MSSSGSTTKNRYVFRAQDFYRLLEEQDYTCPYSGRELTPNNCVAEHKVPLRRNGKHEASNIVLVDSAVGQLKRHLTDEELYTLVQDLAKTLKGKIKHN